MQPLPDEIRAALKKKYPKLTDETLDRADELLVLRTQLDPERHAERIRTLDRERAELIAREMPEYGALARSVGARRPPSTPPAEPPDTTAGDETSEGARLRRPKRLFPRPPSTPHDP
jgi:hypothetical protein